MKLLSLVLALGGFFLVPTVSFAATYYISPSGNDANNGTSTATAWQTIAKVNGSTFAAGDSILFEGGQTFTGSLEFTEDSWDADANNPVVIGSYGTGRATISSGANAGATFLDIGGFKVSDLIFVGGGYPTNESHGIYILSELSDGSILRDITIDNCDISGYGYTGIEFETNSEDTGYSDILVSNNVVHHNRDSGIGVFNNVGGTGVRLYSELVIRNNTLHSNTGYANAGYASGNGIVLHAVDGGLIEYNVAYDNGENDNFGSVGIWTFDSSDLIFQFNEVYGQRSAGSSDGGGFDIDGGVTNSLMQYNYAHDNSGPGFQIGTYNGSGITSGNVFRYNISQNNALNTGPGEFVLFQIGSALSNTTIYNNVFYNDNSRGNILGLVSLVVHGGSNQRFFNNIFYSEGGAPLIDTRSLSPSWTLQGNNYYASGVFSIKWGGTTHSSYGTWQTATNQEKISGVNVGTTSNPLLLNPGQGGTIGGYEPDELLAYSLTADSPLINAGLDLFDLFGIDMGEHDYFGNPIPDDVVYDIGAYEYDSILPTVSITAPQDGATVSGASVTLSATANDNIGITGVQFFVDGGAIGSEITTGPFSIIWDSTSVENGTSTISAVARDMQGNTASSSIAVLVSNTEPSNPPSGSGSSSGSGRRPVATPALEAQAIEALIAQYRTVLLQAHAAGIVLPQNILALLGISGAGNMVRDLQVGSEGADVRNLQTLLIGLGYSITPGATGYFGDLTRAALAQYQKENAILPSAGYFGALTRAYMKTKGLAGIWW